MSSDTDQSVAMPPGDQAVPPGAGDAADPPAEQGIEEVQVTPLGRMLGWLRREPVLVVSLVYALVSVMGMWSNYWFYARLGVPILEYLQGADLFIIGLRRPDYFLVVLAVLLLVAAWGMPMYWALNNPERAAALFARRPWVKWLP